MKITWLYGIMRRTEYALNSNVVIPKNAFVTIEKFEHNKEIRYWIFYNKKLELLYYPKEVDTFVDFYSTPIFKLLT